MEVAKTMSFLHGFYMVFTWFNTEILPIFSGKNWCTRFRGRPMGSKAIYPTYVTTASERMPLVEVPM